MAPIEIVQDPHTRRWVARVVGENGSGASTVGRTPELAARALRSRVHGAVAVLDVMLGQSAVRAVMINRFEELLRVALRRAFGVALAGRPLKLYWVETDEDADSGWIVARSKSEAEFELEDAAGLASGLARARYECQVTGPALVGQPTRGVLAACGVAVRGPSEAELDDLADLAPELRRLLVRGSPDSRQPS